MSLYKYFSTIEDGGLPATPPSGSALKQKDINAANALVKKTVESTKSDGRGRYVTYTALERARIGKYAAENGTTRACRYFSELFKRNVPETTVRRLKCEYVNALSEKRSNGKKGIDCEVSTLPLKPRGRPLLLGPELDVAIQDYIKALRSTGGVVNTAIILAAAEGIIGARCPGKLKKQGGDLLLTRDWAKSLMVRMSFVKRKVSNAGKVLVSEFNELKEQFLADITAEVVMHDIPPDLIVNWDQTGLKIIPTGDWTMNRSGEKIVPIVGSDDKRQITAVLAATYTGKCLHPQLLYQGTTHRCHPTIDFPEGWDIWHSSNHWSNEDTMKRYLQKILLPFINEQRKALLLKSSHRALVIFDGFKGQNTPDFTAILEQHNISIVKVPPNCTDKLQPLDVSVNKSMKNEMRGKFQLFSSSEVQKQITSGTPIGKVKVNLTLTAIKSASASWVISSWEAIQKRPEIVINGFKKAGICDVVDSAYNNVIVLS